MTNLLLIASVILYGSCVTALDFKKCSLKDSMCEKDFYQALRLRYAPTGIPEIGVPVLEPFYLKNVTVPVMGWLYLTLVEGYCEGLTTCSILSYETNLDDFLKTAEILCSRIVIKGRYKISTHPLFCQFVHGSGNGSIVLEDWYFKFEVPFEFVKHEDGEIYMNNKFEEAEYYISDVLKNVTVAADNIMFNHCDVTEAILDYLNYYWWILMKVFGKYFHDISVWYYFDIYKKFFSKIPATKYLSDDLTPYLKEDLQY